VKNAFDTYILIFACLNSLYLYLYWDWSFKHERFEAHRNLGGNFTAEMGRGGAGWVFVICLFFLLLRLLGLY
jgi:hypothetical protein